VMRSANHRATVNPWTFSHHLHHTPISAVPLQPKDHSSQMHGRTTSPPLSATRTRTVRRLHCPATLPFMVARLLIFLVIIPLVPGVVLTTAVAPVALPSTRWS
jgi:hypothetical protein